LRTIRPKKIKKTRPAIQICIQVFSKWCFDSEESGFRKGLNHLIDNGNQITKKRKFFDTFWWTKL
jgi:hypothetical protein